MKLIKDLRIRSDIESLSVSWTEGRKVLIVYKMHVKAEENL